MDPAVGHAPQGEVPEVLGVPPQKIGEAGKGQEGVHGDVGTIVVQKEPAQLLGQSQDLRGAEEPAEQQPAHKGLGVDVGDALVVAVKVVRRLQVVLAAGGGALVVDLEPVVAVGVGREVHEVAHAQRELGGRVDDPVHEVHVLAHVVRPDGVQVAVDRAVVLVAQVHVGLGGHQVKHQPGQNAHGAEGAVHHLEDELVLVFRGAGEHVALGGDDLVLEAGVVKAAVPVGHGLDGAAGHGAPDGDGLELGHHDGDEAQRQGVIHHLAEGHPGLGDADAALGIHLDDLVQVQQVHLLVGVLLVVDLGHLVRHHALLAR